MKRFLVAIAVIAIFMTIIPAMIANATTWDYDAESGVVTVPASSGLTSYFYRLPAGISGDDDEYAYGYGYSYLSGTYSYGYGYGYGYAYFAGYASGWSAGDSRLGFFMGTSGSASTSVTFSVSGGSATNPVAVTMAASGLSTADIRLPVGTIAGTGWTGELAITGGTTYSSIPSGIRSDFDSGSAIAMLTLDFSGSTTAVTFTDELLIKIPYASFPSGGIVKIIDAASTEYSLSTCSSLGGSYYTGSASSDSQLLDVDNYNLTTGTTSASHCYTSYNDFIYVATRHASTFVAGVSSSSGSTSPSGGVLLGGSGGSGGSGGDDDEEDDTTEDDTTEGGEDVAGGGEGEVFTVEDFADVSGLDVGDWRYQVVQMVADTGLFVGTLEADGSRNFDMEGGMNRAMAATVVARYIGCDTETKPASNPFPDVSKDEWYAPSVACLKDMGVVTGKTHVDPPIFDPGSLVTRAEFLKMMVEGYIENNPTIEAAWRLVMSSPAAEFEDVGADDWYSGYINLANEYKLLEGYLVDGKRFAKPNQTIIRIEAAAIVTNFLSKVDLAAIGDPPEY